MNTDNISSACLMLYDELVNDKASKKLINKIDKATTNKQIKDGIVAGVNRLRELGKNHLADDICKKTKGFAF